MISATLCLLLATAVDEVSIGERVAVAPGDTLKVTLHFQAGYTWRVASRPTFLDDEKVEWPPGTFTGGTQVFRFPCNAPGEADLVFVLQGDNAGTATFRVRIISRKK
jgi:hypothetical protein